MNLYAKYLNEIENRKIQNLHPKPIDDGNLVKELIKNIKDKKSVHRKDSINFFVYNILPGTTSAAFVKANFLKEIILDKIIIEEINKSFAFELLSHMKGGPSIKVLLDIALGDDYENAKLASNVLKTQVFLYEEDTNRLKKSYLEKNKFAEEILESYSNAEFLQGSLIQKKNLKL